MNNYIYGPSIGVDAIEIDNVDYPCRLEDPHNLILISGMLEGCCPYIFTYDHDLNSWQNEGHILYGRSSKDKESIEEKQLSRFDGKVMLREIEQEISFIDLIKIKIVSADGTERILLPKNHKLRYQDGDYLKLTPGEELEVSFNGPAAKPGDKIFIVVKGYYLPLKKEGK